MAWRIVEPPDIETSSPEYAKRFSGDVGTYFLDIQEKSVLELLASIQGKTVLDVGGGHGQIAIPMVRKGYEVTVVGSSPECNAMLLRNNRITGKYKFIAGDLLNLPAKDQSYDIVVCFRLISHVVDWKKLVFELSRVARRSVILEYPNLWSVNVLKPLLFRIKKGIEKNTRDYILFRPSMIKNEFEKYGFQITGIRGEFILPMALHRWLGLNRKLVQIDRFARDIKLANTIGSPIIILAERTTNNILK